MTKEEEKVLDLLYAMADVLDSDTIDDGERAVRIKPTEPIRQH